MVRIIPVAALLAVFLVAAGAGAATIDVLSAGAVEPGLIPAAAQFEKETGTVVTIRFAPAPALRQKIAAGEPADLLIAPPAVLDDLAKLKKLDPAAGRLLGRVGVGVAVRQGAALPDVATVKALSQAVLAAKSVVYNRASTGLYMEKLFKQLGLTEAIEGRSVRTSDGAGVMHHLAAGDAGAIGFGAVTEIKLFAGKGVQFVAPLPDAVQNYTAYVAVPLPAAVSRPEVKALFDFLGTKAGPLMAANGIERD